MGSLPLAIWLGIALQLINILRDIGENWQQGRLYLPLDDLEQFGTQQSDFGYEEIGSRWQAFMKFQIARAWKLYAEALPGIKLLNPDSRLGITAAAELYRSILDDNEVHRGQVFKRRAYETSLGNLRLPDIWWR